MLVRLTQVVMLHVILAPVLTSWLEIQGISEVLSLDHTMSDSDGIWSIKDFQDIQLYKAGNCFLGNVIVFSNTTWQGYL